MYDHWLNSIFKSLKLPKSVVGYIKKAPLEKQYIHFI